VTPRTESEEGGGMLCDARYRNIARVQVVCRDIYMKKTVTILRYNNIPLRVVKNVHEEWA
jgi:hypothetical protein